MLDNSLFFYVELQEGESASMCMQSVDVIHLPVHELTLLDTIKNQLCFLCDLAIIINPFWAVCSII